MEERGGGDTGRCTPKKPYKLTQFGRSHAPAIGAYVNKHTQRVKQQAGLGLILGLRELCLIVIRSHLCVGTRVWCCEGDE